MFGAGDPVPEGVRIAGDDGIDVGVEVWRHVIRPRP
jgi:hypothetical protein